MKKYDGAVVLVSHDGEFLDGLVDKVYEFRDGGVREYLGDIWYFLENRKSESLREVELKRQQEQSTAAEKQQTKEDYHQKRENEKALRKLAGDITRAEENICSLEKEIAALDAKMADHSAHGIDLSDQSVFDNYNALKRRLESEMHQWEKLHYELDLITEK